jgi:hypothetical protein
MKTTLAVSAGDTFSLNRDIVGLATAHRRRSTIHVPEGAVVKVLAYPSHSDSRMADVEWNHHNVTLFCRDLVSRGRRIGQATSRAGHWA